MADEVAVEDVSLAAKRKVTAQSIADLASSFASGTRMLFQQTAAPTDWTKEVAAGFNDVALRIVTGTVGGAGADAFTTVFGTSKVTGGHTLLEAEMPSHTHNWTTATGGANQFGLTAETSSPSSHATSATGGDGSHDHTLTMDLTYKDVIIAQKD